MYVRLIEAVAHMDEVAHTTVTATTNATAVLAPDKQRCYVLLINDSSTLPIYLSLSTSPEVNKGIRLNPDGGSYEMSGTFGNLWFGAISAIVPDTGTAGLLVTQGRFDHVAPV